MLVLSRKRGQVVLLGNVQLTVLKVGENRVVLGLDGPREVPVRRAECVGNLDDLTSKPNTAQALAPIE